MNVALMNAALYAAMLGLAFIAYRAFMHLANATGHSVGAPDVYLDLSTMFTYGRLTDEQKVYLKKETARAHAYLKENNVPRCISYRSGPRILTQGIVQGLQSANNQRRNTLYPELVELEKLRQRISALEDQLRLRAAQLRASGPTVRPVQAVG